MALERLNPDLPAAAREEAIEKLMRIDASRSLIRHNRDLYSFIRDGVPVEWLDDSGIRQYRRARVIDFATWRTTAFSPSAS